MDKQHWLLVGNRLQTMISDDLFPSPLLLRDNRHYVCGYKRPLIRKMLNDWLNDWCSFFWWGHSLQYKNVMAATLIHNTKHGSESSLLFLVIAAVDVYGYMTELKRTVTPLLYHMCCKLPITTQHVLLPQKLKNHCVICIINCLISWSRQLNSLSLSLSVSL